MKSNDFDILFFKELLINKYKFEISQGHSGASVRNFIKQEYPEFFNFLLSTYSGDFGKCAYMFIHDMKEIPKCHYCHESDVNWYGFIRGFGKWCSMSCMNHDIEHQKAMHQTMQEKYGCKHALQNKEINKKFRNTIGNKDINPERWKQISNTCIKTCLDRYGVENVFQLEEVKEKQRQTCLDHYGVESAAQSEIIKNKTKKTIQNKVNETPDYWKTRQQKTEQTFLEKYGTKHPQKDIGLGIEKRINTSRQHYGVDWYTQSDESHKNRKKSINFNNLSFDSLWELMVYNYCLEHNLLCEYQPNISFEYIIDNKKRIYKPDFLIEGKIYEVKGDHFFRINKETGEEEMFCPFRNKNMLEEEYNKLCENYNEKYKCMKRNNVIILRENEINNLDKVF